MRPECLLFLWQDCEICAINHDAGLHWGNPQKMLSPDWVKTHLGDQKKKHFHVTTSMIFMFVMHPASVNLKTVHTAHGTSPQDTRETKPRHCFRQLPVVCLNRGDQSTGCSCSQVSPLYFTRDDDLPLCLSLPQNKLMQRQTKSSKLPTVT